MREQDLKNDNNFMQQVEHYYEKTAFYYDFAGDTFEGYDLGYYSQQEEEMNLEILQEMFTVEPNQYFDNLLQQYQQKTDKKKRYYILYNLQRIHPEKNIIAILEQFHTENEPRAKIDYLEKDFENKNMRVEDLVEYLILLYIVGKNSQQEFYERFIIFKEKINDFDNDDIEVIWLCFLEMIKDPPQRMVVPLLEQKVYDNLKSSQWGSDPIIFIGQMMITLAYLAPEKAYPLASRCCFMDPVIIEGNDYEYDVTRYYKLKGVEALGIIGEGKSELLKVFYSEHFYNDGILPTAADAIAKVLGKEAIPYLLIYYEGYSRYLSNENEIKTSSGINSLLKEKVKQNLQELEFTENDYGNIIWALRQSMEYECKGIAWRNLKVLIKKNKEKIINEMIKEEYMEDMCREDTNSWFILKKKIINMK
ncbi:MAG: hypothetical protein ACFFDW_01435 [Candidatus Thorarchaeota archaeon]